MEPSKRWKAVLAAAVAAVLLAACGGSAGDKAGGDPAAVTLQLGTPDLQGFPATDDLEHFAATVNRLSSGRIRVDIRWEASGSRRHKRLARAKTRLKAKHDRVMRDIEHKVSRAVVEVALGSSSWPPSLRSCAA